jgi:hypothetical protein
MRIGMTLAAKNYWVSLCDEERGIVWPIVDTTYDATGQVEELLRAAETTQEG